MSANSLVIQVTSPPETGHHSPPLAKLPSACYTQNSVRHSDTPLPVLLSGPKEQPQTQADMQRFPAVNDFNLHMEYFHGMLSYRQKTEGEGGNEFVPQLYDQLAAMGRNVTVAAHTHGRWPSFAKKPAQLREGDVKIFLDTKCLREGENWKTGRTGLGGFLGGIHKSLLFVPVLSCYGMEGSIGQLLSFDPANGVDRVDNFLLELIIAISLVSIPQCGTKAIVPILMGERRSDGTYDAFPFEVVDSLPDEPSRVTNEEALKILKALGLEPPQLEGTAFMDRTIRKIVQDVLSHQGVQLCNQGGHAAALVACADTILNLVRHVINELDRKRLAAIHSLDGFLFHTPQAAEVVSWLESQNLAHYSRIFAMRGLHSLRLVALLDDQQIEKLAAEATENTFAELKLFEHRSFGSELLLRLSVMDLRKDARSRRLKERLSAHRDTEASALGSFVTRNSIETAFESSFGIGIAVLCSVSNFIAMAISVSNDENVDQYKYVMLPDEDQPISPKIHSWTRFWGILPYGGAAVGYLLAVLAIRYHSALLCRKVVVANLTFQAVGHIAEGVAVTAQCMIVGEGVGRFCSGKTNFVASLLGLGGLLVLRLSEANFWMFVFVFYAAFAAWFGVTGEHISDPVRFICFGASFCDTLMAVLIIASRAHSKYAAHQGISRVAAKYDEAWNHLLNCDKEENLRILKGLTERTDEVHAQARAALDENTWRKLLGFLGLRRPRYVALWNWKQRQKNNDIDELFRDAFSISLDFQLWVGSWISVGRVVHGPAKSVDRAIQKVTRSYRRDPSCLTDLVRCTILVDSLSEMATCFNGILQQAFVGKVNCEEGRSLSGSSSWDSPPLSAPSLPTASPTSIDSPVREPAAQCEYASYFRRTSSHSSLLPRQSSCANDTRKVAPLPCMQAAEVGESRRVMRITAIKNRYDPNFNAKGNGGYRDINLNVEIGYVTDSLGCQFVPVLEWPTTRGLRTHICEIQIILSSVYAVKMEDGYSSYVRFRNEMVK